MHSASNKLLHSRLTLLVTVGSLMLVMLALWVGYRWSERQGLLRLSESAAERLELYTLALESEIARFAYLPGLAAMDEDVGTLFATPVGASLPRVERKLARLNARAGSQAIYLADDAGHVLASSETWRESRREDDRIGLIANELRQQQSGFFAAAANGTDPQHFMAHAVHAGRTTGWVIVQISLGPLESTWVDLSARSASEKLIVLDANDVVIMSSVPAWKHRTLTAVAEHWRRELLAGVRYPPDTLRSLNLRLRPSALPGVRLAEIDADARRSGPYIAQERELAPLGLRLMAFADPADLWADARMAGWGLGAAVACIGLLALYSLHRRRMWVKLTQTRNQLQAAREHLEQQVQQRTNELLQAGRLAALGQMSAGIAHEVNQPLTALRALSSNTVQLLAVGRLSEAVANVRSMGDVAERMGRLTAQLKTFARKAGDGLASTPLLARVADTLLLLDHRLRAAEVAAQLDIDDSLTVRCDPTRLEQVLVNLVSNALDAMQGMAAPRLQIAAVARGDRILVSVADNGRGMSDAALVRLFEPFFTTKPAGQGLGLGLTISQKIISDGGGNLRARRGADAGMVFEFDLECAWSAANV